MNECSRNFKSLLHNHGFPRKPTWGWQRHSLWSTGSSFWKKNLRHDCWLWRPFLRMVGSWRHCCTWPYLCSSLMLNTPRVSYGRLHSKIQGIHNASDTNWQGLWTAYASIIKPWIQHAKLTWKLKVEYRQKFISCFLYLKWSPRHPNDAWFFWNFLELYFSR